jgi:rhodanese-related sulfurtransferase
MMRAVFRQIVALLLLALVPAVAAGFFHPKKPSWESDEIPLASARGWGTQALWLDARPAADYARGHIPGALPLNEDAWDEQLPSVLDAWTSGRTVVVYCSSLSCATSHEVARRLRTEVELPRVYVLTGGWEAWEKSAAKK